MSKLKSTLGGNGETRGKRVRKNVLSPNCASDLRWQWRLPSLRSMLPGGAAAISSDAMSSVIARVAPKSEILLRAANETARRGNKGVQSQNER